MAGGQGGGGGGGAVRAGRGLEAGRTAGGAAAEVGGNGVGGKRGAGRSRVQQVSECPYMNWQPYVATRRVGRMAEQLACLCKHVL